MALASFVICVGLLKFHPLLLALDLGLQVMHIICKGQTDTFYSQVNSATMLALFFPPLTGRGNPFGPFRARQQCVSW